MAALPSLELGGRFLKAGPVNSGGDGHSSSSSNGLNIPMANSFGDPYHATGNWKLDADEGNPLFLCLLLLFNVSFHVL